MTKQDKRSQKFINVGTAIRVTYVKAKDRSGQKNWAGKDVLRFNAYAGARGKGRIFRGAEIPVGSPGAVLELIAAICELCGEEAGPT